MSSKLWILPVGLLLSGVGGVFADTLVMQDGRRIRGELVSISGRTVVFDQEQGSPPNRNNRRLRLSLNDVARINFTDRDVINDNDYDYRDRDYRDQDSRDRDSRDDGIFGSNRGDLGRERLVTVYADRRWVDTGLEVRAGQTIQFEPEGVVTWGPGRQDGPEGELNSPFNSNRPIPNRAGGALIGRIGNSNDVFFIGNDRGPFRVRNSGHLYLGVNDDQLQDNSGAFQVRVFY
jgi:hypothetical protein